MNPDLPFTQWDLVRSQFSLDYTKVHLSLNMVCPNSICVQNEIARHRKAFDQNPAIYYREKDKYNHLNLQAISNYLNTKKNNIALSDSTTAGISTVLNGLSINAGDEIISSDHDHYSLDKAVYFLSKKNKIRLKKIKLYEKSRWATCEEILENIHAAINKNTRIVCLTWVHSCSGIRLPIAKIGRLIEHINGFRTYENKIITVVDAVHAIGFEWFDSVESLNCDFIISGLHKWMFGPRGTGFIWGSEFGWSQFKSPLIVSFDNEAFYPWRHQGFEENEVPPARLASTGGFPAFEHRWAIYKSIEFIEEIGQRAIRDRIISHAKKISALLERHEKIQFYSSDSDELMSGIICFDVKKKVASEVVDDLVHLNLIVGQTPYRHSCVRIAPSILNSDEDINLTIDRLKDYLNAS